MVRRPGRFEVGGSADRVLAAPIRSAAAATAVLRRAFPDVDTALTAGSPSLDDQTTRCGIVLLHGGRLRLGSCDLGLDCLWDLLGHGPTG